MEVFFPANLNPVLVFKNLLNFVSRFVFVVLFVFNALPDGNRLDILPCIIFIFGFFVLSPG